MAQPDRDEAITKIRDLIKNIDICMLTTQDEDGTLRSRPMGVQKTEFDGDLWFFTWADAPKVNEVEREHQVNASFADPKRQNYLSISGSAQIVRDRQKMEELWNPVLRTWFPDGLDDPNVALIKVTAEKAEYWDSPSSAVVHIAGLIKSQVTGRPPSPGENEKLDLERGA